MSIFFSGVLLRLLLLLPLGYPGDVRDCIHISHCTRPRSLLTCNCILTWSPHGCIHLGIIITVDATVITIINTLRLAFLVCSLQHHRCGFQYGSQLVIHFSQCFFVLATCHLRKNTNKQGKWVQINQHKTIYRQFPLGWTPVRAALNFRPERPPYGESKKWIKNGHKQHLTSLL